MFLLFQFLRYHHGFCFQDLHSNMFLLFRWYGHLTLDVWWNLHSNMFLLFRRLRFYCFSFYSIYIPICFYYFDQYPDAIKNFLSHLHSNMFLLFLGCWNRTVCRVSTFTFQYVSIISDTKIDSYIEALTFTFQYVSIISGIPDY